MIEKPYSIRMGDQPNKIYFDFGCFYLNREESEQLGKVVMELFAWREKQGLTFPELKIFPGSGIITIYASNPEHIMLLKLSF